MSQTYDIGAGLRPVEQLAEDTRATFIRRTYVHLAGAIALFTGIEIVLFETGLAERIAGALLSTSWLLVLGGFVLVSWMASRVAHTATSRPLQYLALGGFVFAEALIFVPLLFLANHYAPGAIASAAWVTGIGFLGLTGIAFWTGKDFSFLGGLLRWGGFVALGLIVAAVIFGFQLGVFFSVAMIAFAGAAILYDTSNVMRRYPEDRYVGAALELFASTALMFWYVLRLFIGRR